MLTQTARVGALFVLIVVMAGCSGGSGGPLEEFSPDGKFKIMMPANPKDKSQGIIKIWATDDRDGAFMVSVTPLPVGQGQLTPEVINTTLDKSAEGQILGMGGQAKNKSNVTLSGKYQGRAMEGSVSAQNGVFKSRVYLVGTKLYQLLVIGKEVTVNSDNSTKFLDSLQIIAE